MPDFTRRYYKCPTDTDSVAEYTMLSESGVRKRMEIALETISPLALRMMLLLWYGVLFFGLLMIRLDLHAQWEVRALDTGESTFAVPTYTEDTIQWHTESTRLATSRYARFPHILISIDKATKQVEAEAHTNGGTQGLSDAHAIRAFSHVHPYADVVEDAVLDAQIEKKGGKKIPATFDIAIDGHLSRKRSNTTKHVLYARSVTRTLRCRADETACEAVLLPVDIPLTLNIDNFSLTMHTGNFTEPSASLHPTIRYLSQKPSYTKFGIFLRYALLLFSFANLVIFISKLGVQFFLPNRSKDVLIEQIWVLILQGFFILYANPFHISCVLRTTEDSFKNKLLQFMEFHIADYFAYVVLTWNLVLVNCARFIPKRLPNKTHLLCVSGLFVMIGLDCLLVSLSRSSWSETAQDFELTLHESSHLVRAVLFTLLVVQYTYFVIGFLLAVRLYFKLYKVPYFETRTQQLSFRLFVFVMWLYYVYRIIQSVALHHGAQLASLISFHRSHQLSELLIAFVYTQIITYSYSPARHTDDAPPPPTSSLWKRVAWTDAWYRWLRHHGGSLFFFNTRHEEEKFDRIQAITNASRPKEETEIRPVQFVERLLRKIARRFTNIITLTNFTRMQNRGFFCLEKAIDCFNISWEVYFRIPEEGALSDAHTDDTRSEISMLENERVMFPPEIFSNNPFDTPKTTEKTPAHANLEAPLFPRGINMQQTLREMEIQRFGFTIVKSFLIDDVQAVICSNERCIIIAFRGTSTRKNVRYDMKFSRSNIEEGTKNFMLDLLLVPCVHSGFNILWKKIETDVLNELQALLNLNCVRSDSDGHDNYPQPVLHDSAQPLFKNARPFQFQFWKKAAQPSRAQGKELIITGHSLGGAIANLCAYSIATRFNLSPTVYTFGSPRVGNTRFRHVYDEKVPNTFRIVNQSDIVSRFNLMMDNPHVGCEIAIDRYGNIICHPTFIERVLRPWSRGLGLYHHLLASYGQSLDAVAKRQGMGIIDGELRISR